MPSLTFIQVLRALLVAATILFGVTQLAHLSAGPAERPVHPVISLMPGAR